MNKRKWLSILLCIVLALSMLPVATSAAEDTGDLSLSAVTGDPNGFSNEGYANLFDGNTGSKWCFNFSGSAYVIFYASEPVKLSKYSIATANDTAGNPGRNPVEWTLSACMNYEGASTSWAVIDTVTNGGLPSENETYTDFELSETTPFYQYFKLEITKINSGDLMQISEIALKDYTVCNHSYENGICTDCGIWQVGYPVNYLDENGAEQTVVCDGTITAGNIGSYTTLTAGWYLVKGTITAGSRITISGDVHLILEDNSDFTVNGGIQVQDSNALTVYAQSVDDTTMGKLTVENVDTDNAGIGGGYGGAVGNITINGGIVVATGGSGSSGIGGGNYGSGGTITINGGTVTANGGTVTINGVSGPGISGGSITIYGGTVTAVGGGSANGFSVAPTLSSEKELKVSVGESESALSVIKKADLLDTTFTGNKAVKIEPCITHETAILWKDKRNHAVTCKWCGATFDEEAHSFDSNGDCFCGALQANYLDENGIEQIAGCKAVITADNIGEYTTINAGWYLVKGTITADSRITIYGDVHLILEDGCDFTINGGIEVNEPSSITIYCQQAGTGKLTCKGAESKNGIGGSTARGNITINGGIIYAQGGSNEGGAGIGGRPGGAITINGGTVTAIGTSFNAGIGGRKTISQSGGVITINGGNITAQGDGRGAGIGGAYQGDGGTITITGGIVNATGGNSKYGSGAGIGGGSGSSLSSTSGGSGGTIVITGGTVKATGTNGAAGIGAPSVGGSSGTFSTEKDGVKGNAVIFANAISDQSDKDNWNGVIFIGSTGKVYGTTVTPTDDFEMGSSNTLLISEGSTLKLDGINAVNNGDVYVDGTLNGNFSGTGSIYYPLAVTGGKAGGDISIYLYLDKVYGKAGGTVTLTASDDPMGMKMDGWTADPAVTVINNSFTMPASALTVTARYINAPTYTVTIPASVELGGTATVTAEGVSVADGSQLVVKLSGTSGVNNALTISNGGSDTLTYRVTKGSKDGTAISVNGSVLTVAGGIADNSGSEALYFTPATEPKYAGKYTGTVTFTVSVEAVSST